MLRQLKIIRDRHGKLWLGPQDTEPEGDLEAQGCWRCPSQDLARFTWEGAEASPDPKKAPTGE